MPRDFFVDRHWPRGAAAARRFVRGRAITYDEVADRRAHSAGSALRARGVADRAARAPRPARSPRFAAIVLGRDEARRRPRARERPRSTRRRVRLPAERQPGPRRRGRRGGRRAIAVRPRACPWLRAVLAVGRPRGAARLPTTAARARAAPSSRRRRHAPRRRRVLGLHLGLDGRAEGRRAPPPRSRHAGRAGGRGVFGIGPDDLVFSVSKLLLRFGLGNSALLPGARGRGLRPHARADHGRGRLRADRARAADASS